MKIYLEKYWNIFLEYIWKQIKYGRKLKSLPNILK